MCGVMNAFLFLIINTFIFIEVEKTKFKISGSLSCHIAYYLINGSNKRKELQPRCDETCDPFKMLNILVIKLDFI